MKKFLIGLVVACAIFIAPTAIYASESDEFDTYIERAYSRVQDYSDGDAEKYKNVIMAKCSDVDSYYLVFSDRPLGVTYDGEDEDGVAKYVMFYNNLVPCSFYAFIVDTTKDAVDYLSPYTMADGSFTKLNFVVNKSSRSIVLSSYDVKEYSRSEINASIDDISNVSSTGVFFSTILTYPELLEKMSEVTEQKLGELIQSKMPIIAGLGISLMVSLIGLGLLPQVLHRFLHR